MCVGGGVGGRGPFRYESWKGKLNMHCPCGSITGNLAKAGKRRGGAPLSGAKTL